LLRGIGFNAALGIALFIGNVGVRFFFFVVSFFISLISCVLNVFVRCFFLVISFFISLISYVS
jgi:hypothetical protein